MSALPESGDRGRRLIRAAALFVLAVLGGAAAGVLFGLAIGGRLDADPVTPPAVEWPAAYRCGVVMQPEDLDRADRCACDCAATR